MLVLLLCISVKIMIILEKDVFNLNKNGYCECTGNRMYLNIDSNTHRFVFE